MTIVAPSTPPRARAARTAMLVVVVGFILHLTSERGYWFYSPRWFGSDLTDTMILTGFYAFAAALAVWALGRTAYLGWEHAVLAGVVFAWTVEGVVVHVLHEAGPLDLVFPAMFAGWHGLLAFAGGLVLVRTLLVRRRPVLLAVSAAAYGLIVGSWAITSWLPDSEEAAGDLPWPTPPAEFALTMLLVVLSLAAGHLVLDRLWDADWRPSRTFGWIAVGGTAAWAVAGVAIVPHGPPRYLVLVAVPLAALLLARPSRGPNLFSALRGRIRARDLVALLPAAATASLLYALVWAADPGEAALLEIRELHVFAQIVAGGGVLVWAVVRAVRRVRASEAGPAGRVLTDPA